MIIHDIEQNSPEWYALRAGMPTASEFKKVITSQGKVSSQLAGYAATLAGELFAGKQLEAWEGNQWTEQGHEREDDARLWYELTTGNEARKVGFVTNDAGTIGCSPDRLVGDNGGIEIKCRAGKGHVETMAYIDKNGKCPTDYFVQVQGQMWLCELDWMDLVFYHPDLPPFSFRVEADDQFMGKLETALADLLDKRNDLVKIIEERSK